MLKQKLGQKLSQKLSPQQIQLMKLIQLPTIALEERIQEELEINPALEEAGEQEVEDPYDTSDELNDNEEIPAEDINVDEYLSDDDIPDYRLKANNHSPDDEEKQIPLSGGETFMDHLLGQLGMRRLTDRQRGLGEYLIGNIDDDGYIRRELIHIVDDLAFNQNVMTSEEELEEVLDVVQGLEPAGVGARDLRECLALQLNRRSQQAFTSIAQAILEDHFDAFTKKHYSKIMEKLEIEEETLRSALDEIIKLNPKPRSSFSGGSKAITQAITPDFYIQLKDGNVEYLLNARNAPELNISREYKNMLEHYKEQKTPSKSDKEAVLFVKQKIDSAKWFVEAVRQRQRTLLLVIDALVERSLRRAQERLGLPDGARVVLTSGPQVATPGATSLIAVHRLGSAG